MSLPADGSATPTAEMLSPATRGGWITRPVSRRRRPGFGAHILFIEDDTSLMRAIRVRLRRQRYVVEVTSGGPLALAAYERFHPDLVLLDVDQSSSSGSELIGEIRTRGAVPLIVLSTRAVEHAVVAALELGADDYVTKPLAVEELLARVRVALRHVAGAERGAEALVRFGDVVVDVDQRRVMRGGCQVHLTPMEYDLLLQFILSPDRLLTDRILLQRVWGRRRMPPEHTLHVYMARLRKKLENDPQSPSHLVTESGAGYRLAIEPGGCGVHAS